MSASRDPRLSVARCIVFCVLVKQPRPAAGAMARAVSAIADAAAFADRATAAGDRGGSCFTTVAALPDPKGPASDEWASSEWHLSEAKRCVEEANRALLARPPTRPPPAFPLPVKGAPPEEAVCFAAHQADQAASPRTDHRARFITHAAWAVRTARGEPARMAVLDELRKLTSRRLSPEAARLALRYVDPKPTGDVDAVEALFGMGAWAANALVHIGSSHGSDSSDQLVVHKDTDEAVEFCRTHASSDWYLAALDAM